MDLHQIIADLREERARLDDVLILPRKFGLQSHPEKREATIMVKSDYRY